MKFQTKMLKPRGQTIRQLVSYLSKIASNEAIDKILDDIKEPLADETTVDTLLILANIVHKLEPSYFLRYISFISDPVEHPFKLRPPHGFSVRSTQMRRFTNMLSYTIVADSEAGTDLNGASDTTNGFENGFLIVWDLWRAAFEKSRDTPPWHTVGLKSIGHNSDDYGLVEKGIGISEDPQVDENYCAAFKGHRIIAGQLVVRAVNTAAGGKDALDYGVVSMPRQKNIDHRAVQYVNTAGVDEEVTDTSPTFFNRKWSVFEEQNYVNIVSGDRWIPPEFVLAKLNARHGRLNDASDSIKVVWWPDEIGNEFVEPFKPYYTACEKGPRNIYNICLKPPLGVGWKIEIVQDIFLECLLGPGADEFHENYSYSFNPPIVDNLNQENIHDLYREKIQKYKNF